MSQFASLSSQAGPGFRPTNLAATTSMGQQSRPMIPNSNLRRATGQTNFQANYSAPAKQVLGAAARGSQRVQQLEEEAEDYFGDDVAFESALETMDAQRKLESLRRLQARADLSYISSAVKPKPIINKTISTRQASKPTGAEARRLNVGGGVKLKSVSALREYCLDSLLTCDLIELIMGSSLADIQRSLFKFGVFNAVQSTCFNTVYSSDRNAVISAPTGAGKTVLFELAMLRLFSTSTPDAKVVYIAPTKSLCNERALDWTKKFSNSAMNCKVVELTGDTTFGSLHTVGDARIIVTTAEKWDAMTRQWHKYAKLLAKVRLFW